MIPDEAVEAAAIRLRASRLNGRAGLDWQQLERKYQDEFRKSAREALEAAARHLMAAAWDEGYLAMVDDAFRDRELVKKGSRLADDAASSNPYRKDEARK